MAESPQTDPLQPPGNQRAARIYQRTVIVLLFLMAVELVLTLYNGLWFSAILIMAIMVVILSPKIIGRHFQLTVPAEFQLLAVLFVFASLFLGEIRHYYDRLWWWDIALHASSGLLLGLLGFLLIYVLNENRRIELHLRPGFMALFAFLFAVTAGTLWEIFEFAIDYFVGTTMQKPMLGDDSGLTDTMWDLIVDAVGALLISIFGWWYMKRGERSFIVDWISKFTDRNPRLFKSD
ncbi:MAG: hypothetical protein RI563_01085 [Thiohalophilus sp.]|uniref:hypothetical protein n=1 Tax=Thiohalophilus sp. TaxID=3028392 RepID=UPI00286FB23C|nr:hypothetical protein [Thiohalophilus sp.]MDR9435441.1 hypothetical protein [Thiohalophilus sp.]